MNAKAPIRKPRGAFFGRRKGHPLRAGQASVVKNLLPDLAIDLGQPAPRVDIAGDFYFGRGAAQILVRVDHASHAGTGTARGSAAKQLWQDFSNDVGQRADHRQQGDGQNPNLISAGPDHVHDQRRLNEQRKN